MGQIIGFIIGVVIAAVVLLIVSRLNLGLSVAGFSSAVIGAIVISLVSSVILWLLGLLGIQVGGGSLFSIIVWLIVSAVILLTLDPLLGMIVLAGAPLVALVYRAMSTGALRRSRAAQEQTGVVLGITAESYQAQLVVKAFGLQARELARFDRASDRLFRTQLRLQLFGGIFSVSVNMIVTFLRLIVLAIGYSIGISLTALFFELTKDNLDLRGFRLLPEIMLLTGGLVFAVVMIATILSVRRVVVVDPAVVFRG